MIYAQDVSFAASKSRRSHVRVAGEDHGEAGERYASLDGDGWADILDRYSAGMAVRYEHLYLKAATDLVSYDYGRLPHPGMTNDSLLRQMYIDALSGDPAPRMAIIDLLEEGEC